MHGNSNIKKCEVYRVLSLAEPICGSCIKQEMAVYFEHFSEQTCTLFGRNAILVDTDARHEASKNYALLY